MTRLSAGRQITRQAVATTVGIVGLLAAALLAAGAFFGAAMLFDSWPALAGVAVIVLAAGSYATLAVSLRIAHRSLRRGIVLAAAAGLTVTIVVATAAAVGTPVAAPAVTEPPNLAYWHLPTGSTIAYTHRPAGVPNRGAPVVFLHGGPGTAGDGLPAASVALAAAGFDVYSYDQFGAGRSSRATNVDEYTVTRQVDDLEAIRIALGADRIVPVGQSWGGILAARYLAKHPDRVARVVFTSPGAMWTPAYPDGTDGNLRDAETPDMRARLERTGARLTIASVLQAINPRAAHSFFGDAEADTTFREQLAILAPLAQAPDHRGSPVLPANTPGYWVNQMTGADLARVDDPRPALRNVQVPALIMRGRYDYKTWQVTDEYRRVLPRSRLIIVPDAGHAIAADQPELYERALLAFLTDAPLPLPDEPDR
ncbi:alpha/beta fold hydrolase [Nocardia stercoris]|uniref:Alpha/beta fold hydrolase n=1 Tax=Nocardia stercoris TaxID=2483361 RepID=A0A3M2L6L1_9NOCA|nr:alpha/beta fold hydrolase [Nocardia stercoris]RMI32370.1 alpha/beta fold hydrolase [Nocardia stercoris]